MYRAPCVECGEEIHPDEDYSIVGETAYQDLDDPDDVQVRVAHDRCR